MKRLLLIISILVLSACSANNIPKGFDEKELNTKAETIIQLVNENKIDELYSMFRLDLQTFITLDELAKAINDKLSLVGQFEKISQIAITDTKDPQTSELYAVVIVVSKHKEGKTTITTSFNKELELVGFYIK